MPKVTNQGAELVYEVNGSGEPLLMILGLTLSRPHWVGFDERLRQSHRVVTFDNRGMGESSVPPPPYEIATMAADAIAVLDAAGIESANVVGVSMGGMIAQELCIRYPQRVKKLVLGCTHFGGAGQIPASSSVIERLQFQGKAPDQIMRDSLSINFTPEFIQAGSPELLRFFMPWVERPGDPAGFWGQLAAIAAHDTSARLPGIKARTLVIAGDRDELVPPGNSELIATKIPGARLELIRGAAHVFWVEAADEAYRRIASFLAG